MGVNKSGPKPKPLIDRFSSKYIIDSTSGCWLWKGNKNTGGYGQIYYQGKCHPAHRLSYALYKGDFQPENKILHRCDTPSCVNPEHLFLGSLSDNSLDSVFKGRHTKCLRKLTTEMVIKILQSKLSCRKLANLYNIGHGSIWNIRHGITYKEITNGN